MLKEKSLDALKCGIMSQCFSDLSLSSVVRCFVCSGGCEAAAGGSKLHEAVRSVSER